MTQPTIGVIALLQDNEGQFLIAQRPADKSGPYLWEFPGGKLESGEDPPQALARELFEEVGIHVSPQNLKPFTFTTFPSLNSHVLLLFYLCKQWEGEPYPKENQPRLEWVALKDLSQYPMYEANKPLIDRLINCKDLSISMRI